MAPSSKRRLLGLLLLLPWGKAFIVAASSASTPTANMDEEWQHNLPFSTTTIRGMQQKRLSRRTRQDSTFSSSLLESYKSVELMRRQAQNVTRAGIIDVLDNNDESTRGVCHIATLLPLSILLTTQRYHVPYAVFGAGGLAASALAMDMLNAGDDSVVPELAGLPDRCPLRFTLEAWDSSMNPGFTVGATNELLARQTAVGDREVCAFLGTGLSAETVPMAILTGIAGRPQLR